MPSYQLTLDDTSPLISYSSDWTAGTSASDAAAFRYSQSTFHATSNAGATASLSFNGTGIQIFGAKRDNHGQYQVRVDNNVTPAQNGLDTSGQFQAILFEAHGLTQGRHDVSIMNIGNQQFLDIDFITIEGNIGDANKKLFVNTFQDTDASFSYIPAEAQWTTNPTNLGSYSGSSGHATSNPGSQVAFRFTGDGVSLFGPMSTHGSPYTVELDGVPAQNLSTASDRYIPQSLLYHASGLGDGPHRLVMKYAPTSSGQVFAVDYAQVYTTRGPPSLANNSNSTLSGGAIVGITLAVAVIIGALIAIVWLLLRRRKQSSQFAAEDNEKTMGAGPGPGPVYPFVSQPPPAQRGVSRSNTHSTFGPGPASAFPLADYPQNAQEAERTMSMSSTGARTMVGGLSVNTNLSHGSNMVYRSQAQYSNQLGLVDGPFSPEEGTPSDPSPSDVASQANLLTGGASNGRFMLGSNGYPLEKVPRADAEDIISPVAGQSSSMHPFAFPAPMERPQLRQPSGGGGGNSADDELNPPDYAHATGGPRVR